MAVVDVGISIHDLFLLSDQVELTETVDPNGVPVFQGDLHRADFAAVRVSKDTWHVVKARKPIFHTGEVRGYLSVHHAEVQPPVDFLETF